MPINLKICMAVECKHILEQFLKQARPQDNVASSFIDDNTKELFLLFYSGILQREFVRRFLS